MRLRELPTATNRFVMGMCFWVCATLGAPAHAQASLPAAVPQKAVEQAKANAEKAKASGMNRRASSIRQISGEVAAAKSGEIGFRVQGFIEKFHVDTGAIVKAGEVIAELDGTDAKLQLELAQAQEDQARASLTAAQNEMKRERQLKEAQASSGTTYDKVVAAFKQAQAASALARIQVEQAKKSLERTSLKAPYDCVVSELKKNEGEFVTPGAPVVVIHSLGAPEVILRAPEQLLGTLKKGLEIQVSIPSIDFKGPAVIERTVPVISEQSRSFEIVASLKSPGPKVIPGLFAEARID